MTDRFANSNKESLERIADALENLYQLMDEHFQWEKELWNAIPRVEVSQGGMRF